VPLGRGTNQRAELLAVIEALKAEADLGHAWVTVYSDSAYAVGVLGGGWKAKANHELVDLGRDMVRRCARFRMVQVKGHGGNRQHDRADELAGRAARAQKR
ncbi:MAG: ribonuclease HI, partial [Candidatus Methylomirabilales bacterium]